MGHLQGIRLTTGTLRIGGDFVQSPSGSLTLEVVSPFLVESLYHQQNDRLEVDGQMTLDGTLSIEFLHEYQPAAGDSFDFLDFASLTGEFRNVELPRLRSGFVWDLSDLYVSGQARIIETDIASTTLKFKCSKGLDVEATMNAVAEFRIHVHAVLQGRNLFQQFVHVPRLRGVVVIS